MGNNSTLIDQKDTSHLFKQGFFDENVQALKVDSKEEYAFLVNENRYDGEINSVERATDFLSKKYLIEPLQKTIELKQRPNLQEDSENRVAIFEPENTWSNKEAVGLLAFAVFILILLVLLAFNK